MLDTDTPPDILELEDGEVFILPEVPKDIYEGLFLDLGEDPLISYLDDQGSF